MIFGDVPGAILYFSEIDAAVLEQKRILDGRLAVRGRLPGWGVEMGGPDAVFQLGDEMGLCSLPLANGIDLLAAIVWS